MPSGSSREAARLEESARREVHWRRWGPYLAERAWGTVREDYSAHGDAWEFFPHDHARSRVYRWNEDGLAGFCDRHQRICVALALWNGRDPFLKERLFGLGNGEGNHGEDVKECYYYLDGTPTHSFTRFLYKYPQAAFPYAKLVEENARRGKDEPEFEIEDTGVFDGDRYFDVFVTTAKEAHEEILVRISAVNRGPKTAPLHILPTVWFRNRWSWGREAVRPELSAEPDLSGAVLLDEPRYGKRRVQFEGSPELLFTENETNAKLLFGSENATRFVKDAFHDRVTGGRMDTVNPDRRGTKAAAWYRFDVAPGETATVRFRLSRGTVPPIDGPGWNAGFEDVIAERMAEADEFYREVVRNDLPEDAQSVVRQAFASLLASKQFYHYVVRDWLEGDPAYPPPPEGRQGVRNADWRHLHNADVISMPDKWEYPWYASWDTAFHTLPLALVDPEFAKDQLVLLLREWYMHPNGQLPAYEWELSDVNPPVHAWAAWRVYKIEKARRGEGDTRFLERVFHKLLLNFTWWVNRKDPDGLNLFQGGFLGLDNIGVFDRSKPLPTGGHIEQSDSTSWMAMYTLDMLAISLELARHDAAYEDVASKFWEHFLYIADAMNHFGTDSVSLWDEEDGFYYDMLHLPEGRHVPLRVRSMVGLIPLFAVQTLEPEAIRSLPGFRRRLEWFVANRPDLTDQVACMATPGRGERRLLSVVSEKRLRRVLAAVLDEAEFLSPFGVRSLSRRHVEEPYVFHVDGTEHRVDYEPGESRSGLFGGNSNWRGPVWFPVNYLLIESLQKFHHYFGDRFTVEFPTGSGNEMTLHEVAAELSRRLTLLLLCDAKGLRPALAGDERYRSDPHWKDLVLFHEYFHGDTGRGLGAAHQTGWTALAAKLLQQSGAGGAGYREETPSREP